MDQSKIGKFISECRKNKNLTQNQLAERLNITDRAVSKWETGRSLPDSSLMIELCKILDITVNELLNGEKDVNAEKQNELLLEILEQKEKNDKSLLLFEIVFFVMAMIVFIIIMALVNFLEMDLWLRITLIVFSILFFAVCGLIGIRIEQIAGYYECKHCGHKYIPKYWSLNFAPHVGRTRFLKCPKCGRRSWSKKVKRK